MEGGAGLCPHRPSWRSGDRLAVQVPETRGDDLAYVNLTDPQQPYGYNPLTRVTTERRSLVASGIMELFEKMWPNAWGMGQRMEHILRNSLLALLDWPDAKFSDILRLYSDKSFRRAVVAKSTNEHVRSFWRTEYPKFTYRYQAAAIAPIQNKVS